MRQHLVKTKRYETVHSADGYLKTDFQELADKTGITNETSVWQRALREVQKLDPPGIGARTVQESLLLQLRALDEDHPVERELIEHYFDELQNREFQKIVKQTGHSVERIKEVLDFIKTRLVLHPGIAFGSARVGFIFPDVIVDYNETGDGYTVTIPDNGLPRLYISGHYRRMLQDRQLDSKTRRYIKNNMQSAQWIIEAIEQRRQTLRKVAESIVEAQKEFLENGPKFLKPLPMADVAEKVGVHVATVSRAVADKFVQTPRGLYPLRSFFTGGTETDAGESVSWDAIREKIRDLVDHEDKCNPLSDDQIVKHLQEEGITVARRTVAKYRKLMDIPSSHRRREK